MIISVSRTNGDSARGWPYACFVVMFDDDNTSFLDDMRQAELWCESVDIEIEVDYSCFYFRTREDQIAFIMRWNK